MIIVQRVRKKFEGYTKQDMDKVKLARELQGMIGQPSDREYTYMASKKILPNCPITIRDITDNIYIFVPDMESARGGS